MPQLTHQFTTPQSLEEIHNHLLTQVTPFLSPYGYKLRTESPRGLTYVRERWPTWVILCCIFLFPIGLLTLLTGKQEEQLLVSLSAPNQSETVVTFNGDDVPPVLATQIRALP